MSISPQSHEVHKVAQSFVILLACLALAACSRAAPTGQEVELPSTPPLELPVIAVDDEHRAFESAFEDALSLEYEIPSGIGFILDATGYEFHIPAGEEDHPPNMIQLRVDDNSFYGYPWKEGLTRYTLTSETLNPLGGSQPFYGLFPGATVAVAIGYQRDEKNFNVYWAGIIIVVERD
jgi:hypothetical protein